MSNTESFDSVISEMRLRAMGGPWATMAARLQYDHHQEIRDVSQKEYHRGYEDGMHARATATWQLDQERMEAVRRLMEYDVDNDTYDTFARAIGVGQDECIRTRLTHLLGGDSNLSESPNPINKDAESESYLMENADFNKLDDREKVVRKLQALQFGGGSHENLSQIAYAIYPCATGWTCESAAGLRNKLIELMGGVSDGTANDSRIDTDCGDCGRDFHVDGVSAEKRIEKLVEQRDRARAEVINLKDAYFKMQRRLEQERDEMQAKLDGYERHDTAESIVHDMTLGTITESQAIDRIEALHAEP